MGATLIEWCGGGHRGDARVCRARVGDEPGVGPRGGDVRRHVRAMVEVASLPPGSALEVEGTFEIGAGERSQR